jgi:hypothetical protein
METTYCSSRPNRLPTDRCLFVLRTRSLVPKSEVSREVGGLSSPTQNEGNSWHRIEKSRSLGDPWSCSAARRFRMT